MKSKTLAKRLVSEIRSMPIIDGHAHILPLEEALAFKKDLAILLYHAYGDWDIWQYDKSLLFGANGHEHFWDLAAENGKYTPEIGKQRLLPHLKKFQNTSFHRSALQMIRTLYKADFDEIDASNWDAIDAKIRKTPLDEKRYWNLIGKRGNVKKIVLNAQCLEDIPKYQNHPLFTYTVGMNDFVKPGRPMQFSTDLKGHLTRIANMTGMETKSLEDYMNAMEFFLDKAKSMGCIGAKVSMAYLYPLDYTPRLRSQAQNLFSQALAGKMISVDEWNVIENYLFFHVARSLGERNMIFQIHTGLVKHQCNIRHTDPACLYDLFAECPKTRFDIFHAGYPHHHQLACLAKSLPNVFANMCWMPLISQHITREILSEWMEVISAGKIIGFGSDMTFPEIMAAHLDIAKQTTADVLAQKVESGYISEKGAVDFARAIFYETPRALYGIES